MPPRRVSIGVEPQQPIEDADAFVSGDMIREGADFAILPILYRHESAVADKVLERRYFAPEDLTIKSSESAYCLLGKTSPWIDNMPSSEALVAKEVEYAGYTGLKSVVAPEIGKDIAAYGRQLYTMLANESGSEVLVRIRSGSENAWHNWNRVRMMCNHSMRLQVLLELDADAHMATEMQQWIAEPVRVVVLPEDMFVPNAAGYPVLLRLQQALVKNWIDHDVAFAVQQSQSGKFASGDLIRYIRHMADSLPERDPACLATEEYRDVLQAPLQPLMDHLESVTYETFEQDEPKYAHYEKAMVKAISEVAARSDRTGPIVLMVVGAGRGPLVSRALHAARRAGQEVCVFALEKNPSALVELHRKNATLWLGAVTIVHADMRQWQPTERADILISELLGSFGDNELSPECLDGAIEHLAANDCICIPRRYTAYVAPLSSTLLFCRAREYSGKHHLETPYVVNIHKANVLADAQPVWAFSHESPATLARLPWSANAHNDRSSTVEFSASCASVVHGLVGYFDAELYPGVELSICPATHTLDMHSWFPMYFPIQVSIYYAWLAVHDLFVNGGGFSFVIEALT
ncbi:hypothetical protein IWW36_003229 [Coemansia brasiliensis]|uniref:Protein arginine N-methyltransferase n=1 Tax=Coemansia brasiliensis TaxID=2650707 RepID=A0A9W8I5R0_9FUNG|nr:hypothetical protein IWW36_003229 [Coemansia brasiliensis]